MDEAQDKLQIEVLKPKRNDLSVIHNRVILGTTQRLEYVGTNFHGADHINRHVIGVFDKAKRKIRLIDSPHIFAMEQRIKSFDDRETVVTVEDRVRGNKELVLQFGSKRSRTLLNTSVRNQVRAENNVDQGTLESMSNSLKEKASQTMPLDEIKKGVRSDLPPYDPLGDTREKIYNFASSEWRG
jgi:hypothetical protein